MAKEKMYEVRSAVTGNWFLAKGDEIAGGTLSYNSIDGSRKGVVVQEFWREVLEGTEFTCPQCGSHAFGSNAVGTDDYAGLCHGYRTVQRFTGRHQTNPTEPCNFTWPRKDDEKYFKGTGHYSPALCTAQVVKQA